MQPTEILFHKVFMQQKNDPIFVFSKLSIGPSADVFMPATNVYECSRNKMTQFSVLQSFHAANRIFCFAKFLCSKKMTQFLILQSPALVLLPMFMHAPNVYEYGKKSPISCFAKSSFGPATNVYACS